MQIPYTWMYGLALVMTGTCVIIGAILAVPSDVLQLDSKTVGWLGVVAAAAGAFGGFLPRVTKPPAEEREGLD